MATLSPGLFPPDDNSNYFPTAPQNGGLLFNNPDSKFSPELFTRLGIGLMSGNTVADQLSNGALGAQATLDAQKAKALTTAQQNKTVLMLQDKAPELAQAVSAGIMTPSDAYGAFLKKQQAEAEAAKPKYQLQNIGGKLVRVDLNKGAADQIADFSDPNANMPVAAKESNYWLLHPDEYTAFRQQQLDAKPPTQTELVRNLEAAGYKQGTPEFQSALMQAMKKPGMSLRVNEDGSTEFVQGDVQNTPKLTVEQGKNAGFLIRAKNAEKILGTVGNEGTSTFNKLADKAPLNTGNFVISQDAQKYKQAQRDFINAVLRQESGAVITPEEFASAQQQYFPQPGDGQEVIEQKRQNREAAIEGFKIRAGPGAPADAATTDNDPLGIRK